MQIRRHFAFDNLIRSKQKAIVIALIMMILPLGLFSQNRYHPWAMGAGINFVKYKQKSYIPSGQIWLSRRMNETLNFNTYFLYSHRITFPFSIGSESNDNTGQLFDGGVLFQVNADNGVLLKEKARLSPFLQAGIGGNYVPQNSDIYFQLGAGAKAKLSRRWQMNVGASKKYSLNKTPEHATFFLNLMYCFGPAAPLVYPDYVWTYPNRHKHDTILSISELDMPPKSGDSAKDEMLERIWITQSSLFTDKEKLAILRQDSRKLQDSVRKVADSLAAFQYIGSLDSLYASWEGVANLKHYLLQERSDSTFAVDRGIGDLGRVDTVKNAQVSSLDSLILPLAVKEDTAVSAKPSPTLDSVATHQLNCYDLRGHIFWIDFLINSEEAEVKAEAQIQKIAEMMKKCKVLNVEIMSLEGKLEVKDILLEERRRDFVRLTLHFEHKIDKLRINEVIEPSPSQIERIQAIPLAPSDAGRVYVIFQ